MIKQNKHYPEAMKRMDGTVWLVTPIQDYLTPTPGGITDPLSLWQSCASASVLSSHALCLCPQLSCFVPLSSALMLCASVLSSHALWFCPQLSCFVPLSSALMLCAADFLVVIVSPGGWPPPRESLRLVYPLSSATRTRRGTHWVLIFHLTNGWVRFPCGSCGITGPHGWTSKKKLSEKSQTQKSTYFMIPLI